jgi:DNA-binding CsgD family transcriptional regulator
MDPCDEAGVCSESPPTTLSEEELRLVLEHSGSPAEIAAATGLTPHQVRIAVEYWERRLEAI